MLHYLAKGALISSKPRTYRKLNSVYINKSYISNMAEGSKVDIRHIKRQISPKLVNMLSRTMQMSSENKKLDDGVVEDDDDSYVDFMPFEDEKKSMNRKEIKKMIYLKLATAMDLTTPHLWFPVARSIKRKFHLHVGPTNSGKTFNALEKLKSSPTGTYCGPLRLLAEEIFEKLNVENVKCNLITGQKVIKDRKSVV